MRVRLRPYRVDDERAAVAAHEALLADNFYFLLGRDDVASWEDFLVALEEQRRGVNLPENKVRAVQLVASVHGELVGRVSIRFELNEFLSRAGGNVGYAIVPEHRNKGYATEILQQALIILRANGVERVLITCNETNVGSRRVIEHCGGVFESLVFLDQHERLASDDGGGVRRYWIE